MYNHLLLSLVLFMGQTPLQQTGAGTPADAGDPEIIDTTDEPTADVIPRLWQSLDANFAAPQQPQFRSESTVSRTRRYAPAQGQAGVTSTRTPVSTLVTVRGMEENHVMGIGLVTGLAGTGDSGTAARQLLKNLLLTRNINLNLEDLTSKNIAVVRVEAVLPAGIRPGQSIDVRASTIGDCSSLEGGTLAMTELTDISGRYVFATAFGPVTAGGFSASGESASVTRNHVNVGTLPGGGKVEREVPTSIVSEHGYLFLDLRTAHDSLGNVVHVTEAANGMYPGVANASGDGKCIRVKVPADLPESQHAAFAHSILRLEVMSENVARIVINERTGVIVMGGDVRLQPGIITHGSLTVTISESPEVSQPGPLSDGTTEGVSRTDLDVVEEDSALILTKAAGTLQEVVDVLNVLGATPRDMITILQAMSQSGTLLAEIKRM